MWILFQHLLIELSCTSRIVSFAICFPLYEECFSTNIHFCMYFFIRHYAILKIYSYLIMIYYSNLFCQLWHIFTGICKSNMYWNSLETCISNSNEMYSRIVFGSGQLCEWPVTSVSSAIYKLFLHLFYLLADHACFMCYGISESWCSFAKQSATEL